MNNLPNFELERTLPDEVLDGVLSGRYQIEGGVIREASGTESGGEIVRHLIPFNGGENSAVLEEGSSLLDLGPEASSLLHPELLIPGSAKASAQILQAATASTALAGIGLVVSLFGFAKMNRKLNQIDGRLEGLQEDVQEIKDFLEETERSRLRQALRDLARSGTLDNEENRHTMLHNARQTFGEIQHRYAERLGNAEKLEEAIAYEDYYCLTGIAHARSSAELGMSEAAQEEMDQVTTTWRTHVQNISERWLVDEDPERFLAAEFAEMAPTTSIAEWLDLTHGTHQGIAWIDTLRSKLPQQYAESEWKRYMPNMRSLDPADRLSRDKELVVPTLNKFAHRHRALQGYVSQYSMLHTLGVTPAEFGTRVRSLTNQESETDWAFLKPSDADESKKDLSWAVNPSL